MLYLHRRLSEITLSRQLPKVVGYGLWLDDLCVWIRGKYLEKHRSHTKCHTKWTANIWLEVNIFSGINSCDQLTPNLFQLFRATKTGEKAKNIFLNIFISSILYVQSTCHKSESSKPGGFQRKTGLHRGQRKESFNLRSFQVLNAWELKRPVAIGCVKETGLDGQNRTRLSW